MPSSSIHPTPDDTASLLTPDDLAGPVLLHRSVRFFLSPAGTAVPQDDQRPNGYAGWPRPRGLAAFYQLDVTCRGELDPVCQYLVDIKAIDRALRRAAIPEITRLAAEQPHAQPASLLPRLLEAAQHACPAEIVQLTWRLSPYLTIDMNARNTDRAVINASFDFAASHRLYVPELSEEENLERFGKCARPNGHGHNYRLDVHVEVDTGDPANAKDRGGAGDAIDLAKIEQLTETTILDRFDHRHLNLDTPEFGPDGVIPTVENIARVFYRLLSPRVDAASGGNARLRGVTVWETDRTSASYPADRNAG